MKIIGIETLKGGVKMPFVAETRVTLPIVLIAENTNNKLIAKNIEQCVDLFVKRLKQLAKQDIVYNDNVHVDCRVLFYSLGVGAKRVTQYFMCLEDIAEKDVSFDDSVNLNELYYKLDADISELCIFDGGSFKPQIVFFVDLSLQHFHNNVLCKSLFKNFKLSQAQVNVCCFGDGNPDNVDVFNQFDCLINITPIHCDEDIVSVIEKVALKPETFWGFDGTHEQYSRYRQYAVRNALIDMLQNEETKRLADVQEKDPKSVIGEEGFADFDDEW